MINIQWFGHSMWQIKGDSVLIVTDPFTDIGYKMDIDLSADIILSSHDHFDHNNFSLIKGNPQIVNQAGKYQVKGVEIKMIPVWHDHHEGSKRGQNLLMKFTVDSKVFLHCGDLGHIPNEQTFKELGIIDVLMIPVGAVYTIDHQEAYDIAKRLSPSLILPMHYNTPCLNFELESVDNFLKHYNNIIRISDNQFNLTSKYLNKADPPVIIIDYEKK